MNGFLNDLRFGLRQLIKRPGFAAAAIITLALGIGANTAVFSVLNGYLLKPLPYPNGQQLVAVNESFPKAAQPYVGVSEANYLDTKHGVSAFSNAALYNPHDYNLTRAGQTRRVSALQTRSALFDVLQVKPYLGHAFGKRNDRKGASQVAVLSYGFWQKTFGGDPNILDQTIELDGQAYRITGIMPRGFQFPDSRVQLWVPFVFGTPKFIQNCRMCELDQHMIARLKPGATLATVRSQRDRVMSDILAKVSAPLRRAFTASEWKIRVRHYRAVVLGNRTPLLLTLQGFVLLVLLMTCVNVANLLLARILGRTHEMAMRAALGASRWRLARQLFVEGLCLAVPGGLAGVALGWFGLSFIQNLGLSARLGVFTLTPDWRVGLFALGVVVLVTIVISLLPIRHLNRTDLQSLLQEGSRGMAGGRAARRTRNAMVIAEIALAAALLGGTGLLVNSFVHLQSVDPGFKSDHVLTADILLPSHDKSSTAAQAHFYARLLQRLRALPGVVHAGLTGGVPIKDPPGTANMYGITRVTPTGSRAPDGNVTAASPGYFKAMHIALLRGRRFEARDSAANSRPVIIIDKFLADKWFHGKNPIGHQMIVGGEYQHNKMTKFTIIGEVASVRAASLDKAPVRGTYYLNALQKPDEVTSVAIKTAIPPYSLAQPVKQMLAKLDPLVSISNFASMHDVLAQSLQEREAVMILLLAFACLGLALAAVGVYGVLSYVVGQRTQECGIRLALGAEPKDLLWLITRDGLKLLAVGLCIGLGLAILLGFAISSQLFNVAPFDPATLAGVVVALSIITLAACYLPARRASRLEPVIALREQ
jgi:putative ABC transport system permease protein